MRNLTIQRQKSFVGCLAALQVYIEDPEAGDLNINGCQCRKLGKIKNDETVTYQIPDDAARVYVIADKLSKNYCNEFYPLPAGTEDVILTGKCHYNPTAGNPFRFDGVTDETVLKNRKRGSRIGAIILVIAVLVGFAIGMLSNMAQPKTFAYKDMQITLTDKFQETDVAGFDYALETSPVCVLVLREPFATVPGSQNYSLQQYAKLVQENNKHTSHPISTENGVTYYEYNYTSATDGETYHYIVTMYKGPDAFWLIQYLTFADETSTHRDEIFQWAASVTFTE